LESLDNNASHQNTITQERIKRFSNHQEGIMVRYFFGILFCILVTIFHAGCFLQQSKAFGNTTPPLNAQKLIYGEVGSPIPLYPLTDSDAVSLRMIELIFDGLVGVDKNGDVKLELAKDVEILNEGLMYIFHLHDGIQWHDGHPFTAHDIEFTFDLLTKAPNPFLNRFDVISQVQAIAPDTVVVTLRRPVYSPLLCMNFKILPKHILEKEGSGERFGRNPVGTGAFKWDGYLYNNTIRLTANRNKIHNPKIDIIYQRPFDNAEVAVQALLGEEIDLLPEFPIDYLPLIRGDLRRQLCGNPPLACIAYNLHRPYLQDVRVRQAFTYALDRSGLLQRLYYGYGTLSSGPFPPGSDLGNPCVKPFASDLQKAQALLAAAKDEGKFTNSTLIFKVSAPSKGEMIALSTLYLHYVNTLDKDLGVKVEYEPVEWLRWKQDIFERHDFDITYIEWSFGDLMDITPLFHSSATGPGQSNIVGYSNPKVDNLIADLNLKTYYQFHQIIANDCPYTFLWWIDTYIAYNKRLRNVSCHDSATLFENIEEWEVRENDEQ
jgi:peptide/nickel transport system substrate-binding protein